MGVRMAAEPSLADWKSLYDAASDFRACAPWKLLTDADLFAVTVPGAEEPLYCSVMGGGGMEYGLVAYRGAAGLFVYALLGQDALDDDEAMLLHDCLMFNLASRSELDREDIAITSALGLRFPGRRAWPLFRSCRPNYLFSHVPEADVAGLADCIEQACCFARELEAGRRPPVKFGDNKIPLRRRTPDGS